MAIKHNTTTSIIIALLHYFCASESKSKLLLWYSSAKTNRVFGVPQSSACRGVLNQNTKAEDLLSFPRNVSDDHFGKHSYVILEQSPMSA